MIAALRRVLPYAFGFCLLLLAVLSWTPGPDLPRTELNSKLEHFIAYAGTMLVGGLAWPARRYTAAMVGGLSAFSGLMELGQFIAPGRHPSVWDFLVSSAGVVTSALLLRLFTTRST